MRLLGLLRPRVSLAVAAGSLFGALFHGQGDFMAVCAACVGSFVLCAGCSALNQVQERARDARMTRTRTRPLPAGLLSPALATAVGMGLTLSGLLAYAWAGGWRLLIPGLAIVAIYNGVYTLLKPVTPVALLVGGVAGAAPPLMGWLAAGGGFLEPRILSVTGLFYLWQVPHFWLVAEKHRSDYERAGFAMIHARIHPRLRARLMGVWVGAYFVGLACLLGACGPAALNRLTLPMVLAMGAWASTWAARGLTGRATAALYGSLPLGLAFTLWQS